MTVLAVIALVIAFVLLREWVLYVERRQAVQSLRAERAAGDVDDLVFEPWPHEELRHLSGRRPT